MKLKVKVLEIRQKSWIVFFIGDKENQRFEIFVENEWRWVKVNDEIELSVKFRSVEMKDINNNPTYDTQLYTEKYYTIFTPPKND